MKRQFLTLLAGGIGLALAHQNANAQDSLSQIWFDAPSSQTWLPTGNLDRGIGYDAVTGDVLVVDHTGPVIEIVNGSSGIGTGTLNVTGLTGGTFVASAIGVAADGSIYAANLTTASTTTPFKIYRWANEGATATVAYSGDPGAGTSLRYGDDLAVTGSGTSTEILAGSGSGTTTTVGVFTTTDGSTFSSVKLTVAGTAGTDMQKGIAFGPGGTIYGRQTSTSMRQINASGTLLGSYTLNSISGTIGPIAYDPVHNLLAGIEVSTTAGVAQRVNLYDVSTLTTSGGNQPVASFVIPSSNGNANLVGDLEFSPDGSELFALDSDNGLIALSIVPEPSTVGLSFAGGLLAGAAALRRRFRK